MYGRAARDGNGGAKLSLNQFLAAVPKINQSVDIQSINDTILDRRCAMNITSDIKPVSYLKSHAAEILKQINDTHRPMVITQNGEPKAVLQDPESYDNMRKAITLLKLISEGEENIKHGQVKPQEKVFENIEKVLAKRSE